MKSLSRSSCFHVIALAAAFSCATLADAANTDSLMAAKAKSASDLQHYHSSHSLADLDHAVSDMQAALNLDELTPQNFIIRRRAFVQGWATVIHAIETAYAPGFDPNAFVHCPVPPGGAFPPCSDPSVITDPSARAAYGTALNSYKAFQEKRRHYVDLQSIDNGAMNYLEMGLDLMRKVAPDGTSSDFTALDSILQQAGVSGARRDRIDAMFYARPVN